MQTSLSDGTAVVETSQADAQALQDYAQAIITGEELMFILDVPAVPPQDTHIVVVQASTATAAPQADYILKTCQETEHTEYNLASALRGVDPAGALKDYVMGQRRDGVDIDIALFKPSLLQGTSHGTITEGISNYGRIAYRYDPEPGFYGDDQAVFMVEFEGKHYKIIYQIKVMEYVPDYTTCPPPKLIKVTKPSSSSSS